jgi:Ca2+-binding EF-hand superfamily protein
MKKLDVDRDGEITDVELTRALKTVEAEIIHDAVETAIKKIASGAEDFSSMREYVKVLFKKFDLNNDGLITFQELSDGLKRIQIYISSRE